MSLELRYERLAFNVCEAENLSQSVIEGSITLPEGAPEIGRALRLKAHPCVRNVEVSEDKVLLEGACDVELLYVTFVERAGTSTAQTLDDEEDGYEDEPELPSVEERLTRVRWTGELPFAFVLELPGVQEGQDIDTHLVVQSCTYDVRSDQVTLDVDVAVEFRGRVDAVREVTVAGDVDGAEDVDVSTREMRVKNVLGVGEGKGVAEGSLNLPGGKVPEEIIDLQAMPQASEVSVEDGCVRVKGYVDCELLYTDDDGPQHMEWERGVPFEIEVPVEGAVRGADAELSWETGESECRLTVDEHGACLDVRTPLTVDVKVGRVRRVPVIVQISSETKEVATREENVLVMEAVGEGATVATAAGSLDLPEGSAEIERILCGEASVHVDDVHVLGDRVLVELRTDVEMLYVGRDGDTRGTHVVRWPQAFTLDVEVPVPGAEPGLERSVEVRVDRLHFDPINRYTVDVRADLNVQVELRREVECTVVVEAAEVPPAEAKPPTYTFVVVNSGDTLWKLAARYRSDTEAIVAANPWLEEEGANLEAGRKVCVPRHVSKAPAEASV